MILFHIFGDLKKIGYIPAYHGNIKENFYPKSFNIITTSNNIKFYNILLL